MQKFIRLASVGIMLLSPLMAVPSVFAASATMSLSPGSGSEAEGSTFTLNIYENSGTDPVSAVSADLSYPANLLSFDNISSSYAFGIVASNSGGNGSVNIDRGAIPAVTGNQLVASVRFKVLASSGTASVTFNNDSKLVNAHSNAEIPSAKSGGIYNLEASSMQDTTLPTITGVMLSDVGSNAATVTWTSSKPATSEVDYGVNSGYGLATGDGSFVLTHKLTLNSALITPGEQYHFVVKSVDSAGNAATSQDQTFTTKGATLNVTVVDQYSQPVYKAKVTIGSVWGITDKKGQVALSGLQDGKTVAVVNYKNSRTPVNIEVKSTSPGSAPQSLTLTIHRPFNHLLLILLPLLGLAALVALTASVKAGGLKGSKKKPHKSVHKPTTASRA